MRDFLDIDPWGKKKPTGEAKSSLESESEYEDGSTSAAEWDEKNKEIFFSFADPKNNRILNMKVNEANNRWYELQYFEIINEQDIQNNMCIEVSPGELKTIQILIK